MDFISQMMRRLQHNETPQTAGDPLKRIKGLNPPYQYGKELSEVSTVYLTCDTVHT